MKKSGLLFIILLLLASTGYAQVTVTVISVPESVDIGETVTISVTVTDLGNFTFGYTWLQIRDPVGDVVLNQTQYVNPSSFSWTPTAADEAGTYTATARVRNGNDTAWIGQGSDTFTVTVLPTGAEVPGAAPELVRGEIRITKLKTSITATIKNEGTTRRYIAGVHFPYEWSTFSINESTEYEMYQGTTGWWIQPGQTRTIVLRDLEAEQEPLATIDIPEVTVAELTLGGLPFIQWFSSQYVDPFSLEDQVKNVKVLRWWQKVEFTVENTGDFPVAFAFGAPIVVEHAALTRAEPSSILDAAKVQDVASKDEFTWPDFRMRTVAPELVDIPSWDEWFEGGGLAKLSSGSLATTTPFIWERGALELKKAQPTVEPAWVCTLMPGQKLKIVYAYEFREDMTLRSLIQREQPKFAKSWYEWY
ncbi:MAG: hypothetical protein ACE5K4_05170 [Candidatus Hydrothermarchaeota archaeon]